MNNDSKLEKIILAVINATYEKIPPTEEEFNDCAEMVRNENIHIAPVSDEEFISIKRRLREIVVVDMDKGVCLKDHNNGHQSWLPSRRASIDFFFWERYKNYLEGVKNWGSILTSKLGQITDDILDECGDPELDEFHVRGLIIGDVQSGKTANYTALINKAADVGYDLIIVLAGISEVLRRQTQIRLDQEFCGRQSNLFLEPQKKSIKYVPVGVGRYGNSKKIACFTSVSNDFAADVLKSNGLALTTVRSPILLVVKKNKTILNNLYIWLKHNNSLDANGHIAKSLFFIDDEADNASINTKDPDSDPTAINNAIRALLSIFSKTTYVAVTATPYANIFINPSEEKNLKIKNKDGKVIETINNAPDIFPADFIYTLNAPSEYIGAEQFLSKELKICNKIELKELEKCIPQNHKKSLIVKELPDDMYEASNYFILANAIRDYRHDEKEHRSMMIHVSRFIKVQNQIADILNAWLDHVKSDIRNYSQLPIKISDRYPTIKNLHNTWNKYNLTSISGLKWEELLKTYLLKAIAPIDVRSVNGENSTSSLDYENHKENGLRVIAVGGNTLSRGLTLEGLMTTYFHRNSNMYDTLLQMARWFGFRPNYKDLVKVWISQDEIDSYGYIYDATQDLKKQVSIMKDTGLSPRDFGLKVKQSPGALIVTARSKMRNASTIKYPISVSGHLLETPRLVTSKQTLSDNSIIIEQFIDRLSTEGNRIPESDSRTNGNYFWEGVSSESIAELVRSFKVHPWSLSFNSKALSDYITNKTWPNGWDVVLIKTGTGNMYSHTIKCGNEQLTITHTEERQISVSSSNNMLYVSRTKLKVGSGNCTIIGLTKKQIEEAEAKFSIKNGIHIKPKLNTNDYLVLKDRNPILMIHILNAKYDDNQKGKYPEFLFAIGLGFPAEDMPTEFAYYQVNQVELSKWIDVDDIEDE